MKIPNTSTIINIKTDKNLKRSAQEVAKELGIPLSTAINAFLKQFIRDKEITLSATHKPSPYLETILEEAEKELVSLKDIQTFDSVDELFADLDN